MKQTLHIIITSLLLSLISSATAQPCLPGWKYSKPVIVSNGSSSSLNNFQFEISFNSSVLINAGKMNINGSDLRVLTKNGTQLPMWVQTNTFNTANSSVWVKTSLAASASDTLYLFYGNPSAISASNGDLVFEFFDDFSGSFSTSKWDTCGNGSYLVSTGKLRLSTSASNQKTALISKTKFSNPVKFQMGVSSVSKGKAFLANANVGSSTSGYAVVYEEVSTGVHNARINSLSSHSTCFSLSALAPPYNTGNSVAGGSGDVELNWFATGSIAYKWNGGEDTVSSNTHSLPSNSSLVVGLAEKASASADIDWVFARKYSATTPSVSLGSEFQFVTQVQASGNNRVCQNDSIKLEATNIPSASYAWLGPNGFTAITKSAFIPSAQPFHTGWYKVTARIGGGCSSASDSIYVAVDSSTLAGSTAGSDTLCEGTNQGAVRLAAHRGSVIRWEYSYSGNSPWGSIASTADSLNYSNLNQSVHYRAVIKNGVCAEENSSASYIQIDQKPQKGSVVGTRAVCDSINSGSYELLGYRGQLRTWTKSTDYGATWSTLSSSAAKQTFTNLNDTTWFRAQLSNGVCGYIFSDTHKVNIHPLPDPAFGASSVCEGQTTTFTNSSRISSGSISAYSWNFGNGSGSVLAQPSFIYSGSGVYVVQLEATSSYGCKSLYTDTARVHPVPKSNFSFTSVCQIDSTRFTNLSTLSNGNIANYRWSFGSGNLNSTTQNPVIIYPSAGNFITQLIVTSDSGCADSISKLVRVYANPIARFTLDTVPLGSPTSLTNSSSISSGNLSYFWSFGDGNTSTQTHPKHTYSRSGKYPVGLIAVSSFGCGDTLIDTAVVNDLPLAAFSVQGNCLGDTSVFVNLSSSSKGALSYHWTFGDGTISTDSLPKKVYSQPGVYTITLRATDAYGGKSDTSGRIEIHALPVANFEVTHACDSQRVEFKNFSTLSNGNLNFSWDFGNGDTSTQENPALLYDSSGTYVVKMVAQSGFGCSDSLTKQADVYPIPVIRFSTDTVCLGQPTTFLNSSTVVSGSIVQWSWSLGDGSNSIEKTPRKTYLSSGVFHVELKATSNRGCVGQLSKTVEVYAVPKADFETENVCDGEPVVFRSSSSIAGGSLNHNWNFGDNNTSQKTDPVNVYDKPGDYFVSLMVSSANGCSDSISKWVKVYALPQPFILAESDSLSKGNSTRLFGYGGQVYNWSPVEPLTQAQGRVTTASPSKTTKFYVSVLDSNGCSGTAQKTVRVEDDFVLIANNVLTPDNNGKNDLWYIKNVENYSRTVVQVFDRWGREVYYSDNYQNDWDGTNLKGEQLPDGDYFYIVTNELSEKVYKGTLTLLRNE